MANSEAETILLVNMFSGSYLISNTAHEMINIFKPDKGPSYLYVPPRGTMTENVKKVLMVRHLGSGIYEVIGRARVSKTVSTEDQGDLLSTIRFNKKTIPEIIKPYKRDVEKITFEAESCKRPQLPLYLCCPTTKNAKPPYDEQATPIDIRAAADKSGVSRLFGESQRRYIRKKEKPDLYNKLNELFDDNSSSEYKGGWIDFPNCKTEMDRLKEHTTENSEIPARFLSLIGKEDSELAYSNMLAFFLEKDKTLCEHFLSKLLGAYDEAIGHDGSDESGGSLVSSSIAREEKRIDLLIETEDKVFILENKINAPLDDEKRLPYGKIKESERIGKRKEEYQKAFDRFQRAEDRLESEGISKEWLVFGQLQKYVDEVSKELKILESTKSIHVFILCPSRHELFQDYDKYRKGKAEGIQRMIIMDDSGEDVRPVPVVSYSDIRNFLKEARDEMGGLLENLTEREKDYFDDFLAILDWQEAEDHSDLNKDFMNKSRERFIHAVESA